MAKDLAIAVIHGMGSQDPSFADPMIEELDRRVGKDADRIAWKTIFWADILAPRQRQYFRDANRNNDLDYVRLRKFVISALGDAAAYQKVESAANTTYERIHERVEQRIGDLFENDLERTSPPLIVLAHSLGGHIMSNYIWDMQHAGAHVSTGLSEFERMRTLAGMVTFGCNIPLFTFAYDDVIPIDFPAPKLPDHIKGKARWLNFFDPDDILGYPLKSTNAAYRKVVNRDIAINAGGIFSSWNPLSHNEYWTDNDFTKPVARFIASFL